MHYCNILNRVEERLLKAGKSYVQLQEDKRLHKQQQIYQDTKALRSSTPAPKPVHQPLLREVQNQSGQELPRKLIEEDYRSVPVNNTLSPGSSKILEKMERLGKVEDRLLEAGAKVDKDIVAKQNLTILESQIQARPSISPYANRIKRKGNVCERLSNDANARKEKMKSLQIKYDNSFTFSPKINQMPSPLRGAVSERRSVKELKPPEFPFKPAISQKSQQLAAKLGKPMERLLTPPKQHIAEDLKSERECSFYPITNPRSSELDNRQKVDENGRRTPRCLALYELHKAKKSLSNAGELEVTQQQNCTFMPMTNSKSISIPNSTNIAERLHNWAAEREIKLQHKRKEEEDEELTGCTFSPKISSCPSHQDVNILRVKGVDKFLDRQFKAKLTKQSESETHSGLMTFGNNQGNNQGENRSFQILNSNEFLEAVKNLHEELWSF